jgi:adenylate cyclase
VQAFLSELKKRKVIRVALVYLVAGWLIMQVVDVMFPALSLPEWAITLAAALLIIGFPVALILSWAYEVGPGGLRREQRTASDLQAEQPEVALPPDTVAAADNKTVAVLPFVDLSPDGDQEYFSDGLTEELLNALAQVPDLGVSSRTSCFAFKGAVADVPTVAAKLGAAFVVEGSVRKAGKRLRITAQLIEASSDTHLWSQTYDRDLDDIFAIQEDIARQIAEALQVKLLPRDLPVPATQSVEAYEYFLRGRSHFNRLGHRNLRRAIEMFGQATRIDPDFARAWAGLALAHAYCVILFRGGADDMRAADEASSRAIALAPGHSAAYTARIMVMAAASRYKEAEAAFDKAVELNPMDFEAHYQFARLKWKQGDLSKAMEHFERARAIDPADFQAPILSIALYRGRGEEAKAREAARQGARAVETHLEQHPDNPRAYILGAGAVLYLGDREKALQYVESALRIDPESEDTQYNAACFYANAGEHDKALDCLERGVHDPDWVDNDSDMDPLRDHPRFKALMKRIRSEAARDR